jgi:hypothetical protein
MLTSELRYGDLWSMREFNHFDFELNGIIRAFLRTAVNDFMDSVHHIWCPLSSQEYQDLPDGAETTLTFHINLNDLKRLLPVQMQQLHVILYVISFHYSLRPHQTSAWQS